MLKKQRENLSYIPQQASYLFCLLLLPQAKTPPSSPRFDHLAFCASLRHRAQRPQETLSTFLNAPLLSMPSSQVWDTAPPRPQQGTKRLRARFGLISGIGPAGLNQDLALNLFQEILLKFPPILPTQCSHGKKKGRSVRIFLQLHRLSPWERFYSFPQNFSQMIMPR